MPVHLISNRHRWTGRYEAHLWDKSTWNQNQNKKGKQGISNCLLNAEIFLSLMSLLVYNMTPDQSESDIFQSLQTSWKLQIDWWTIHSPSLLGWVDIFVRLWEILSLVSLQLAANNTDYRCIWRWGSCSQSIWSCSIEVLGPRDTHQFPSEIIFWTC